MASLQDTVRAQKAERRATDYSVDAVESRARANNAAAATNPTGPATTPQQGTELVEGREGGGPVLQAAVPDSTSGNKFSSGGSNSVDSLAPADRGIVKQRNDGAHPAPATGSDTGTDTHSGGGGPGAGPGDGSGSPANTAPGAVTATDVASAIGQAQIPELAAYSGFKSTTSVPTLEQAQGYTGSTPLPELSKYSYYQGANADDVNIQKSEYYDTQPLKDYLRQSLEAAQQQSANTIDYGVERGVNDLNRALEDAQQMYQTERNQVSLDERQAMDNAALYAEMRGDNGGVGQAQYNSVQNTAAQNRLAINNAQTKLATDTARQIADLRAQGEFDKADQLLTLTQNYLSQLIGIEQWGAQYNLSVDQINQAIDEWTANFRQNADQFAAQYNLNIDELNNALDQWRYTQQEEANRYSYQTAEQAKASNNANALNLYNIRDAAERYAYEAGQNAIQGNNNNAMTTFNAQRQQRLDALEQALSEAQLTGVYNGKQTLAGQKAMQDQAGNIASLLTQYGVTPSVESLKALGLNDSDAKRLAEAITKANAPKGGGGGKTRDIDSEVALIRAVSNNPDSYVNAYLLQEVANKNYTAADALGYVE